MTCQDKSDDIVVKVSVLTHTHGNTQISDASDQDGQQGAFGDGRLGILEDQFWMKWPSNM